MAADASTSAPIDDTVEDSAPHGGAVPNTWPAFAHDNPAFANQEYRTGVIELLAVLACGEISACERLVEDAAMAPSLRNKVKVAEMATSEFNHFRQLRDALVALGQDPYDAMEPFAELFNSYHRKTKPADFIEGLVKAYVGDGLAADFYREVAAYLDADTRELIVETMSSTGHSDFVVGVVRQAIVDDPRIAGRLALWGRRLMGEALSQAQRLFAERDSLSAVLVGGIDQPGMDLAALGRMMTRITEAHTERMGQLGLDA